MSLGGGEVQWLLLIENFVSFVNCLKSRDYLSEHNVKWKDLEEEVGGNGQNLLLFLILLHDVAVGGVIEIQPAQNDYVKSHDINMGILTYVQYI